MCRWEGPNDSKGLASNVVKQTRSSRVQRYLRTKVRQDVRALTYSLRRGMGALRDRLKGTPRSANPHLAQLPRHLVLHDLPPAGQLQLKNTTATSDLVARAHALRESTGVFPISFSSPREVVHTATKTKFLSSTIPGEPYSYDDEAAYLEEYRRSHFALSTKKSGWDCFRHLEIIFSGAIPLIPGLESTPPGVMFAYPKDFLIEVFQAQATHGPLHAGEEALAYLTSYAESRLTATGMARYLLESISYDGGDILFIDFDLDFWTDYQSIFTLIGLKRVLGPKLHTAPLPHYLTSLESSRSGLYGLGFGYRGALHDRVSAPESESIRRITPDLVDGFERVILGQFFRDFPRFRAFAGDSVDLSRVVGVVGDDYPESRGTLKRMAESDITFFVRELYAT